MTLHALRVRLRSVEALARARLWSTLHRGVIVAPRVRVGRGCRLILEPGARLSLGHGCAIDDGVTLAVYNRGRIALGPRSFVGHHATLAAHRAIDVGEGTYLAELVSVRDHDHAVGAPLEAAPVVTPVVIGAHAWLGAKVTVLRGAQIGDGAVAGANAVVRGELPPRSLAVGVPARVLRQFDDEQ